MRNGNWQERRRCNSLTWEQADKYFFGSKPMHKVAKRLFCDQCPVLGRCLYTALDLDDQEKSFTAGTEWSERQVILRDITLEYQKVDQAPTRYLELSNEIELLLTD